MVAVIVSLLLHHIHSACSVVLEPLSLWMNTGPDQGWSVPSALAPQHLMGYLQHQRLQVGFVPSMTRQTSATVLTRPSAAGG